MAKTKRRPGGGRKPKGPIREKRENFSTRITGQMRDALENEAQATGQSISQVAERLLWTGLEARRRGQKMGPIRALSFLFERIALAAANATYVRGSVRLEQRIESWMTDPFAFRAFKVAVAMLLDFFEPQGPAISPLYTNKPGGGTARPRLSDQEWHLIGRFFESPDVHGAYIYSRLLSELLAEEPGIVRQAMMVNPRIGDIAYSEFYGLQKARRDLGLAEMTEKEQ